MFPILKPPPTSLHIPSLWVIPVHQPRALVSCIQLGLVLCFTLDSILVSMLFSHSIPPSPSPTESKRLFCTAVSLFLFCLSGYCYHLFKFYIYALSEWLLSKSLQAINAGEGVEKREPSYTVGGNENWYNHYGEQCGDSLKNWK